MSPHDLAQAATFVLIWYAEEYDLQPADLARPGTLLVADPERDEAGSILALMRPGHCFLRVPSIVESLLRVALAGEETGFVADIGWVTDRLPLRYESLIADFHLLLLDPCSDIAPRRPESVRALGPADREIFTAMQAACGTEECEMGEIELDMPKVFGVFEGKELVSQSAFLHFGEGVADVGVLTHPEFRRRGYGREAVAALCRWGLDNNERAIIYRVAEFNQSSRGIARSLGFTPWATFDILRPE